MKVIYDPETDTLNIILRESEIIESDEIQGGIIVDYDKDGRIVSIEILDASEYVDKPESIIYELKR